jgi:hypothetical protein
MATYTSTITEISVHTTAESPIFGENVVKVRINDHAAGAFLELSSNNPDESVPNQVSIDAEQFHEVVKAVALLTNQPGLSHEH